MVDWHLNSKITFLFLISFIFSGCGVKAPPLKYPETAIDSYVQEHTGNGPTPEELERSRINKDTIEAAKKNESPKTPITPNP